MVLKPDSALFFAKIKYKLFCRWFKPCPLNLPKLEATIRHGLKGVHPKKVTSRIAGFGILTQLRGLGPWRYVVKNFATTTTHGNDKRLNDAFGGYFESHREKPHTIHASECNFLPFCGGDSENSLFSRFLRFVLSEAFLWPSRYTNCRDWKSSWHAKNTGQQRYAKTPVWFITLARFVGIPFTAFQLGVFSKFFQPFRTPAPPKNRSARETSLQIRLLLGGVGDAILDFCQKFEFFCQVKKKDVRLRFKVANPTCFPLKAVETSQLSRWWSCSTSTFVRSRRSSIHPGLTMDNRFFQNFSYLFTNKNAESFMEKTSLL